MLLMEVYIQMLMLLLEYRTLLINSLQADCFMNRFLKIIQRKLVCVFVPLLALNTIIFALFHHYYYYCYYYFDFLYHGFFHATSLFFLLFSLTLALLLFLTYSGTKVLVRCTIFCITSFFWFASLRCYNINFCFSHILPYTYMRSDDLCLLLYK